MTNQEILQIAMRQSAFDSGCAAADFLGTRNQVFISQKNENARKYLALPFDCDLTSYGNCIVASVSEALADITRGYLEKYPVEHCFETPNLLVLEDQLRPLGLRVCFMAEYFLPDVDALKPLACGYAHAFLQPADFAGLYTETWSNALCENRKQLDVLAVAAFDKGEIIGLAGCSADCDTMWQIGVDVLPAYRCQGVASALTSLLALAVLRRDKVPFYCCAWSNLKSARNAIKSGFRPAWVQLTAKPAAFVNKMNA